MHRGADRKGKVLHSAWVTVHGRPMHALVPTDPATRAGPPLVLVHGLGVSGRYLVPTALRLADPLAPYIPDLPGFGRSPGPPAPLDVPALADALAAWARAHGLRRASFLGNSLGCQVLADLAVRHPQLVERLVLVGPALDCSAGSVWRWIGRLLLDIPRESIALVPVVARDYLTAGPLRILRTLRLALADPLIRTLPQVRAPALVVRGEYDPIAPQEWAERVCRLLPRGQLVVLPRTGHAVNFSAAASLAGAVRPFLTNEAGPGDHVVPRAGRDERLTA